MAIIKITYSQLSSASNYSASSAEKLEEYAENINNKISSKLENISDEYNNISSALESTRNKIAELNKKAESMRNFSKDIKDIGKKVKETDKRVAKNINDSLESLNINNKSKVSVVMTSIYQWLTVDVMNKSSLGRWVKDTFNKVKDYFDDLATNIRHWYRSGGGKYIVDSLMAVVGAVVAVVACISASGVVLALLVAAAAFAVVNGIANIIGNSIAYIKHNNGDPAWAKRYDKNNKLSEWLKFLNKKDNKVINFIAYALDLTETVVTVANCVYGIGKGLNSIAKSLKDKGFSSLKNLFDTIGSKFITTNQNEDKIFTLKSIGNGLKSLCTDPEFLKSIWRDVKTFGHEVKDLFTRKKVYLKQFGNVLKDLKSGDSIKVSRSWDIIKLNIKDGVNGTWNYAKSVFNNMKLDFSSIGEIEKSGLKAFVNNDGKVGSVLKGLIFVDQIDSTLGKFKSPGKIFAKNLTKVTSNFNKIIKTLNIDLKSVVLTTLKVTHEQV